MCHILHYQLKLRYIEAVYVHRYIFLYQTLQTFYDLSTHPNVWVEARWVVWCSG